MSILPAFKAVLKKSLSEEECRDVVKKIRGTKGVMSAAFNKSTREVRVTYRVSSNENERLQTAIRAYDGVKWIKPAS